MTTASQNDLFTAYQEWATSRQMESEVHSKLMHRIITALPGSDEPGVASNLPTPCNGRPFVIHPHQNGECTEKQTPRTSPEITGDSRRNRPVLVKAPQSDDAESEPFATPTVEEKPKPKRAKRVSETDIRKAVKLVFDDEDMTQKRAEIVCGLPPGTLSRRKGMLIMEQYRKAWGTPTRVEGERGARRKDVEDANKYENR